MAPPKQCPVARFMQFVEADGGGCWNWIGGTKVRGYGYFWDGQSYRAHVWLWKRMHGEHDTYGLDHLCRNRSCVNPSHLEPVTAQENLMRSDAAQASINAAKTHCVHGHEFSLENTYVPPKKPNSRYCRACRNEASKRAAARTR